MDLDVLNGHLVMLKSDVGRDVLRDGNFIAKIGGDRALVKEIIDASPNAVNKIQSAYVSTLEAAVVYKGRKKAWCDWWCQFEKERDDIIDDYWGDFM